MTAGFTARHPRLVRALATSLVALAALLAAVWLAPRASGTAATWLRTPAVHLRTLHTPGDGGLRVGGGFGPRPLRSRSTPACASPWPASSATRSPAAATIRLRTSLDGLSWSRWYRAPLEVADETGRAEAFTDPVWTGDARYVQVAATAGSRRTPAELSGVRLVAIDPTGDVQRRRAHPGHAPPRRRHDRRRRPRAAGPRGLDPAGHRHPRPVGRRREAPLGLPAYSPGQDGLRPPHGQRQHLHAGRGGGASSAASTRTTPTPRAWAGATSATTSSSTASAPSTRAGTAASPAGSSGRRSTASTPAAPASPSWGPSPTRRRRPRPSRRSSACSRGSSASPVSTLRPRPGSPAAPAEKYKTGSVVTFPVIAGHRQANYTECPGDAFYALLPAVRTNVASAWAAGRRRSRHRAR